MSPQQALALPFALALSLPALAAQTAPPPPVRFKVLVLETHAATSNAGNEEARCINAAGETAGQVLVTGGMHAARWSADGALTDLGITGGCAFSSANGISDTGAVVGASLQGAPDNAFLWTPSGGTTQLALPSNCYPASVLDDGSIAFTAIFSGQQPLGVLWHPGVSNHRIIAAGSGDVFVRDLSPSGSVAGHAGYPGVGNRAFRWTPHLGLVDLDPPAGFTDCTAYGLDDEGTVVGVSTAVASTSRRSGMRAASARRCRSRARRRLRPRPSRSMAATGSSATRSTASACARSRCCGSTAPPTSSPAC
jgi:uncharacterized membrane protein